eukprot:355364-Chlamydomonas_euryale.AAC.7
MPAAGMTGQSAPERALVGRNEAAAARESRTPVRLSCPAAAVSSKRFLRKRVQGAFRAAPLSCPMQVWLVGWLCWIGYQMSRSSCNCNQLGAEIHHF